MMLCHKDRYSTHHHRTFELMTTTTPATTTLSMSCSTSGIHCCEAHCSKRCQSTVCSSLMLHSVVITSNDVELDSWAIMQHIRSVTTTAACQGFMTDRRSSSCMINCPSCSSYLN